jgi:hypothetical protein
MRGRAVVTGLLTLGLGLAFPGARASAGFATITQVFSIPLTQTDYSPGTPAVAAVDPFVVQQFNAAANGGFGQNAHLVGVGVRMDYTIENTIAITFANTATINVQASGTIHLIGPGGNDLVTPGTFSNSANLAPLPSDLFPKTVSLPTKTITGNSALGYNDSSTLNTFTGTGTVSLPVIAAAQSSFTSSSGNGFGGSTTLASVTMTLTYFFVVPEPASVVLTGLGGAGLLLMFRSRGRRRGDSAAA